MAPHQESNNEPQVLNVLGEEALEITHSAFGSVGRLFTGEGVEVVWVKKEAEEIDPGWFSQPMVDLIHPPPAGNGCSIPAGAKIAGADPGEVW